VKAGQQSFEKSPFDIVCHIWCSRFGKLKLLGASLPTTKPGEEKKEKVHKNFGREPNFPCANFDHFLSP